jgi:hypothetical protein
MWLVAVESEPPPALQAQVFGNVVITWPDSATNYALETTSDSSITNSWTPVTNTPALVNSQFTITNAVSLPSQYYRLKKP